MHGALIEDLSQTTENLRRSTVQVEGSGRGAGSGVIWRADGAIITNAHVLRRGGAQIRLWDGRVVRCTVVARDPQFDLALLQADASSLPAASIADSDAVRVGELVLAMGSPYGHAGTATVGVVHAAGNRRWIEVDVRLGPGNSGGPLADAGGRVIGINTMIVQGLALAIPSNIVERFVARRGSPARRLGVTVQPVDAGGFGLLILEVDAGGLAHDAGLQVGDILTGSRGERFQAPFDLALLLESSLGSHLRLDVLRGGRPVICEVNFDSAPVGAGVG
jgi:serine protease Do